MPSCPICGKEVANPAIAGFKEFCSKCVTEDIVLKEIEAHQDFILQTFKHECYDKDVYHCFKGYFSNAAERDDKIDFLKTLVNDMYSWKINALRNVIENQVIKNAEKQYRKLNPPRTRAERHREQLRNIRKRISRFASGVTEEMCDSLGLSDDPGHFEDAEDMFRWVAAHIK